jgi:hypothetical protein
VAVVSKTAGTYDATQPTTTTDRHYQSLLDGGDMKNPQDFRGSLTCTCFQRPSPMYDAVVEPPWKNLAEFAEKASREPYFLAHALREHRERFNLTEAE